jgi:hypothetical protein
MANSIHSKSNRSISLSRAGNLLGEPEIVKLQRDLDSYTRKLEQEKRRLFSLEESHNIVLREYKDRKNKMDKMTSPNKIEKRNTDILSSNLQNQLEQSLTKYNEILAANQKLRAEIDVVRRERVTYENVRSNMGEELRIISDQTIDQATKHTMLQGTADRMKDKILKLKEKNSYDQTIYLSEYEKLQQKYKEDVINKRKDTKERALKSQEKLENLDTQMLLKRRLQRIILSNKEKVKVIDQYRKNMAVIDEAFHVIQESSGITDIEEIMNTFIKSEEQNYSLFNYVNVLTQDLDFLEENNKDLAGEIEMLEHELTLKQKLLEKPPEEEVERQKVQEIIIKKESYIQHVRDELSTIRQPLEEILKELSKTKFCAIENLVIVDDFILNEQTIDSYLSIFEEIINKMIPYISKVNDNKDYLTSGLLLEELNVKDFDKVKNFGVNIKEIANSDETSLDQTPFLEEARLKEIAKEAIERYKEKSISLGASALLEKSVREAPLKGR